MTRWMPCRTRRQRPHCFVRFELLETLRSSHEHKSERTPSRGPRVHTIRPRSGPHRRGVAGWSYRRSQERALMNAMVGDRTSLMSTPKDHRSGRIWHQRRLSLFPAVLAASACLLPLSIPDAGRVTNAPGYGLTLERLLLCSSNELSRLDIAAM